ncbi:50S ribosomal protein L21 [Treponema phagedenis]|uniref:Large ribosomal subunit protein bL21 n=1 Tax=Treponema phagedenis TaxID=162 RepID=A0A0B7GVC2_TREPH|nr:50S ribosomal protein L21 [Treponema phagedenis]EFW38710.1 ribosomal protein L21 [Treponema phagedenis F0421]NVP25371.1 50S ribosomal protein L21 [Treponema phagedenis]QEJ94864.1 50S ribosomal protein L21 [Treponema phagedenis]QEJ97848.1 50S ribosomal protein L21 [Treponema phagedenis]QEK00764.1 50S ribosomal protein L21 [Treponema phagedenis]
MYALVEYKGKQYKVEKGSKIRVDKIAEEQGSTISIDTVLMLSNGDTVSIGTPYVANAKVSATVGESFRDRKVIVYKYKSKKDYHRTIGHRQHYTYLTIDTIEGI